MNFNKEDFRKYMKYKQYEWGSKDMYIAELYGDKFTYNEMLELKNLSIRKILIKYQVEVITDIPWGKGIVEAREDWKKTLKELAFLRIEGEKC